jgi:hypothetical protein
MDGQWVSKPDETGVTADDMMQPWLLPPRWDQPPMPPCVRCGAEFAAHLDSKCPPAQSWAPPPRPHWPRRHPLLAGAILLVALLGGIGVGSVSANLASRTTGNARACSAYWQINNAEYAFQLQAATEGWHKLQASVPGITDPELSASVKAFDVDLGYADLPDAQAAAISIEASCNSLGYGNPG